MPTTRPRKTFYQEDFISNTQELSRIKKGGGGGRGKIHSSIKKTRSVQPKNTSRSVLALRKQGVAFIGKLTSQKRGRTGWRKKENANLEIFRAPQNVALRLS